MPRLTFSFFIVISLVLLVSCANKIQEKKDFTGLSGKINPQAEILYSQARLLWKKERTTSSVGSEICSNPQKAVELLNKAIILEPLYADALLKRGIAKSDLNKFAEAFDDITLAIRINPIAENYAARGLVSLKAGETHVARKDILYSLELNDTQAQAWNYLAMSEIAVGNDLEACTHFQKACDNGECSQFERVKKKGICK